MGKDICISCGSEHDEERWGAKCNCGQSNTVHQIKCSGCDAVMGQITSDDYCSPEKIYCPWCINKAKNPAMNKWIEAVELIKEAKHSLESARSLGLKMTALDIMGGAVHKLETALNILQRERE